MDTAQFFTSTEFYVIATAAAAAVIGLCVKPVSRREAKTYLLAGTTEAGIAPEPPALHLRCRNDGAVEITRTGLDNITDAGAISLAITVTGFDISIEERLVIADCGEPRNQATFILDFLAPEYYHIQYRSENTGLFSAFTLHVRPGIEIHKTLSR